MMDPWQVGLYKSLYEATKSPEAIVDTGLAAVERIFPIKRVHPAIRALAAGALDGLVNYAARSTAVVLVDDGEGDDDEGDDDND